MKRLLFSAAVLTLTTAVSRAQWTTETYQLQPGWNAIYTLNDCSHVSIDALLAAHPTVTKVWRWVPSNLTSQFIASPDEVLEGQEWKTWVRGQPANTTMTTLQPNYGHLVYVSGVANLTLTLKGRAVMPHVEWRSSGANLVGFPAQITPSAPLFGGTTSGYMAPLAALGYNPSATQIYQYIGGEISATNPARVAAPTSSAILRGKAYWVNLPIFSNYVSPVKVELSSGAGMAFGTRGGPQKITVKNTSRSSLTVTLTPTASETPPAGEPALAGTVPLLRRSWNTTTQAFEYLPAAGPLTATLAAGASADWTLVPDRAAMTGAVGDRYATVLRVTDGSFSDITVPITAEKGSLGGLWVGDAVITGVQNQLQRFARNADGSNIVNAAGQYVLLSSENTNTATAQDFRLRVIVHVDQTGAARLLSNVYYGVLDNAQSTLGFTGRQNALKADSLKTATRITAAHLPLDIATVLTGSFAPGGQSTLTVNLPHTDATNPFLHTYHPDHDNLDARFNPAPLAAGIESHTVGRAITLTMDAASPDADPGWGVNSLTGGWAETLTGLHKSSIAVQGRFTLRRLSEVTSFVP